MIGRERDCEQIICIYGARRLLPNSPRRCRPCHDIPRQHFKRPTEGRRRLRRRGPPNRGRLFEYPRGLQIAGAIDELRGELDGDLCSGPDRHVEPPQIDQETYINTDSLKRKATGSLDLDGSGANRTIVDLRVILDGVDPMPPPAPKPKSNGRR